MIVMEAIRIETRISQEGLVFVPDLKVGEEVEVIVLRKGVVATGERELGWAKGKIKILPGFDDPIPGMEDYA